MGLLKNNIFQGSRDATESNKSVDIDGAMPLQEIQLVFSGTMSSGTLDPAAIGPLKISHHGPNGIGLLRHVSTLEALLDEQNARSGFNLQNLAAGGASNFSLIVPLYHLEDNRNILELEAEDSVQVVLPDAITDLASGTWEVYAVTYPGMTRYTLSCDQRSRTLASGELRRRDLHNNCAAVHLKEPSSAPDRIWVMKGSEELFSGTWNGLKQYVCQELDFESEPDGIFFPFNLGAEGGGGPGHILGTLGSGYHIKVLGGSGSLVMTEYHITIAESLTEISEEKAYRRVAEAEMHRASLKLPSRLHKYLPIPQPGPGIGETTLPVEPKEEGATEAKMPGAGAKLSSARIKPKKSASILS